jgi:hypothetical protein
MSAVCHIWSTVTFFKEFELNGRCSPANRRTFSVILAALDKHRRMFHVCNCVPQYFGELVIRGLISSFLILWTKKRREVSFMLWGKYELRPAVKKLYQLRPELSTPNMTSCAPRLVRNYISCIKICGCTKCPTIGRFLQFYCTLLYTQLYAHIQNCWMISTTQLLYHVTVWCLNPIEKIFSRKKTGTFCS